MASLGNNSEGDTFFSDHLSHFSGARTNPYAIQVAAQICKDFKLSVAGQRRLNKALNDLPVIEAFDPKLSFGWSIDHIIRSPRVHQFGYEHLTIVITLAECVHETYAAEVFHCLASRVLPPGQNTPHIYQWLDLLHFCNGILANDDFAVVVESFILLDPHSVVPGGKYSSDRCLVPPDSVADALLALFDLTSGKRETLTLRGGAIIGWIAALAEHFCGLPVTIESKGHEHLHGPKEGAKLNLIYTEKPELILEQNGMQPLVKEVSTISLAPFSRQIHFLPYGGRISWQTLLQQVFGQSYHDLEHIHAKAMYIAIGTAFRAIEGAKDASSISVKAGPHTRLTNPPLDVDVEQLTTRTTAYLSSLQKGQARIERQFRLSPQEAAKTHMDQLHYLASKCQCVVCRSASDGSATSNGTISSSVNNETAHTGYCLPSIVETVVMIALMLSRVVLDHPINPSREGVQLLYKLRTDRFTKTNEHNTLSSSPNTVASLYDDVPNATTGYVLRMAVKFFAGGHLPPLGDHLLPEELLAIAHEGICAFASELVSGKNVKRDMKGMISIVNGGFGISRKTYRLATWSPRKPGGRETWQWEEIDIEHLKGNGGKLWMK